MKKPVTTKKNPDFIFICRKCSHIVYITKSEIMKLEKTDCPECGEEPYGNWIFNGEGNFDNRDF